MKLSNGIIGKARLDFNKMLGTGQTFCYERVDSCTKSLIVAKNILLNVFVITKFVITNSSENWLVPNHEIMFNKLKV